MNRYPVPAKETRTEMIVINSRFIASAGPAFSVEQASDFIARIKTEFPNASHHVPVYLIGYGPNTIAHCSDAGEPAGTAGRPALAVLQRSGIGDIVVVITRYFGGTKLGTGGLVRAYSDAVRAVLAVLPCAERVPTHTVMMAFPYPFFERLKLMIAEHHGVILDQDFGMDVTISARFPVDHFLAFQKDLRELSRGSIQAEIIETNLNTILPIEIH